MQDDTIVDLRQFRHEMAKEHGKEAVDSAIMDNFVAYRRAKFDKTGTQADRFGEMKMQFGEMKFNQASELARHARSK